MIPVTPFEAEYLAHDKNHKPVWMPCTVIGVREGSLRYEFVALTPYDDDMMCVMSYDDVRVSKPASASVD
jgi:hypothetical protein